MPRPRLILALAAGLLATAVRAHPGGHGGEFSPAVVEVALETNALPFSGLDAAGRATGFSAELMRAVGDATGLHVHFRLQPWDVILAEFRRGGIPVLGNVAYSPEREALMDFSLSNFDMRGGLFVRADGPGLAQPADLRGRTVAVLRESLGHDYARARQAAWGAELLPVDTREEAVQALRERRVDAFLSMQLVTQHHLREEGIRDIVPAALAVDDLNYQLHFAVRKGDAALLRRLNEGLLAVHRDGTYDRLYEHWLGPLEPRRLTLRELRPFALPALAGLALILTAFGWQRHMLHRVSRQAEAVRRSEARLQLVLEATEEGFWDWDVPTGHVERSPRLARILGCEPSDFAPRPDALLALMHPEDAPRLVAQREALVQGRTENFEVECRLRARSGEWRWILNRGKTVARDGRGRALRVTSTYADITARKQAAAEAERLRQKMLDSQKLESLGVLAGGIAHDFNNLLTIILGNASLNQLDPTTSPASAGRLAKIHGAGTSAADLCRQLLAYAGRGTFSIERVRLNDLVQDTTRLLEVTIAHRATLDYALAPDLPEVEADPTQLRQVLMNLVINAAEAMPGPGEGRFRVVTSARRLAAGEPAGGVPSGGLAAGDYVCLEVSDNGSGMTAEVRQRIFDPFFTTKFTGRGLGLAAVTGIVRSHRGALQVESTPGQGSTFRIHLPVAPAGPVV